MENNLDKLLDGMLEKIAKGYAAAKEDWKADRRNPFKDGRLLAYYEIAEAALRGFDAEDAVNAFFEKIARGYAAAKEDWKADRRNPFKDGRFLAYFEMLRMIPAC